jgi:predicted MFS family arabinose efflux permease
MAGDDSPDTTERADVASSETHRPVAATVLPGVAMIATTFGLARYGYGLLLPDMQAEIGLGPDVAGLVSSAAYVSYLAANTAVVVVLARWGARIALGAAAALGAAGMTVVSLADNAGALALGVLLAGAASGLAFPPYADLVARHVPTRHRDLAWSTISSATGWGVAVAGPVAILLGQHWRMAWAVFVVLAVAAGATAIALTPRGTRTRRRGTALHWRWFLCPRSGPLLASAVLVGTGSAVWWTFSVDTLRAAGADPTTARVTYAVCGAASLLASLAGALFDRFGLRRGYLLSTALLGLSLVALGPSAEQPVVAVVVAVAFGAAYATVIAAHGIWSARVFAHQPAAGLAAVNTALTVGTLTGPAVAGLLIAAAGHTVALGAAGLVVVAATTFRPPASRRDQDR